MHSCRRRISRELLTQPLAQTKTLMSNELRDVTGYRGEKIIELCLTDYTAFPAPLFRPGFLGDKWPAIDFYVELTAVPGKRLYFFGQVKATTSKLTTRSRALRISTKKEDIERLLQIPGPTYILGVHEPSRKVYARSVHAGVPISAITSIPITHELNSTTLKVLHDEVRDYWKTNYHKPSTSAFA